MKGTFCDFSDTQVKDSRPSEDSSTIKRRRMCIQCGGRFTTLERLELREILVKKRNGEVKPFEENKVLRSLQVATRKRPVTSDQLEHIVSEIMKKIDRFGEGEVESRLIGKLVMDELAKVDQVAYVRYASVYKEFAKATDFGKFIAKIANAKK